MRQRIARKCLIAALASVGLCAAGVLVSAWAGISQTSRSAAIWIADDDEGPSDPGTTEGDEALPRRPGGAPQSEDDTQQEASPKGPNNGQPEFGGCLFEKRDLGLII